MISSEQIAVAVDFWASFLAAPVQRENGDDSSVGLTTRMMAIDNASRHPLPTEGQLAAFKDHLGEMIRARAVGKTCNLYLDCDYGPDVCLAASAKAAGISSERFPWKTRMVIKVDSQSVEASIGYGRPYQELMK